MASRPSNSHRCIPPIQIPEGYDTDGDLDGFVTCDEGTALLQYSATHPAIFNDADSATDYDDFESPQGSVGSDARFFVAGDRGSASSTAQSSASPSPSSSGTSSPKNNNRTVATKKFHLLSSPQPLKSLPKIAEGNSSGDEISPVSEIALQPIEDSKHLTSVEQTNSYDSSVRDPWKRYSDDEGNQYWYNEVTGESSWYLPDNTEFKATAVTITEAPVDESMSSQHANTISPVSNENLNTESDGVKRSYVSDSTKKTRKQLFADESDSSNANSTSTIIQMKSLVVSSQRGTC